MGFEIPPNVIHTVLGGILAVISGLMSQWAYSWWRRNRDIKEIQNLLNKEFTDLYIMLRHEQEVIIRAKKILKTRELSVERRDMAVLDFRSGIVIFDLTIRVWDTIISSGNLIKLEHSQIRKIHNIQQKIKYHVKYIDYLESNVGKNMEIKFNGKEHIVVQNPHNMHTVELYIKQWGEKIEETLDLLKTLDKELFDHDKIKNFDQNYYEYIDKKIHAKDTTSMKYPTSEL